MIGKTNLIRIYSVKWEIHCSSRFYTFFHQNKYTWSSINDKSWNTKSKALQVTLSYLSPQVKHLFSWGFRGRTTPFLEDKFSTLFVLYNFPPKEDLSSVQKPFSTDFCFLKDFTSRLLAATVGVVANMLITLHC